MSKAAAYKFIPYVGKRLNFRLDHFMLCADWETLTPNYKFLPTKGPHVSR